MRVISWCVFRANPCIKKDEKTIISDSLGQIVTMSLTEFQSFTQLTLNFSPFTVAPARVRKILLSFIKWDPGATGKPTPLLTPQIGIHMLTIGGISLVSS